MHRICMMGAGYVGLVSGACLADFGNQVTCVDLDERKIRLLKEGKIPFYEFGMEELVQRNVREGRLTFSTDLKKVIQDNRVLFICVGTPRGSDGEADLKYVDSVAESVGKYMNEYKLIVQKSTVPVGTGRRIEKIIADQGSGHSFDVASNPEFLREGSAIEDFMRPNRIVLGTWSKKAEELLTDIYKPLYLNEAPIVKTTVETAELVKYASNAFLATKISFINEIANLCEFVGSDIKVVERAMGLDRRIGSKFLHAGAGYGGSCFPKDTEALYFTGKELGYELKIVKATIEVNDEHRVRQMKKVEQALGEIKGKKIAMLGLSFKPQTDDIRFSVALDFMRYFLDRGALVSGFDPVAMPNAKIEVPEAVYVEDIDSAVKDADAVVISTEWNEFRRLNLPVLKKQMRGDLIVDLRNIYDPAATREAGFRYIGVGRGFVQ